MNSYIKNEKISDIFIKSLIFHTEIKPPVKINADFFEKASLRIKLNQFLKDLDLKGFKYDKKLTALILKSYSLWDGFNFDKIKIQPDKYFKQIISYDFSEGLLKDIIKYFISININYKIPDSEQLEKLKFINSVNENGLDWTLINLKIKFKDRQFMKMIYIYNKVRKDIESKFKEIKQNEIF